jgi:hypothetical protein
MERKNSDRLKILKMEVRFLKAKVRALTAIIRSLPGGYGVLAEWSRQDKLEKEEMKKRVNKVLWESLEGFRLPSKGKRKKKMNRER